MVNATLRGSIARYDINFSKFIILLIKYLYKFK
jgi:hypothetical protein